MAVGAVKYVSKETQKYVEMKAGRNGTCHEKMYQATYFFSVRCNNRGKTTGKGGGHL